MTRAEIIALSDEAGTVLTPERLSATPLSAKQRKRIKDHSAEKLSIAQPAQQSKAGPAYLG